MAVTKGNLSVLSAVTTTQTSSAQSLTDAYAAGIYVTIVVVGTATTGASFILQWSPDGGTTYYNGPSYVAGLSAATYSWVIAAPPDATHVKVAYTQQSGGTSSTLTAQISKITAL